MPRRRWIKLWTQETLYGTTSRELELPEQAIWYKFLALAGDSPEPGKIEVAPGVPYTPEQLSQIVGAPINVLKTALKKMVEVEKISINSEVITITNWDRYQAEFDKAEYMRGYMADYRKGYHRYDIPAKLRKQVFERDGYRCVKCGATKYLQIDHIIPWPDGGPTELTNLQTLCRKCNQQKKKEDKTKRQQRHDGKTKVSLTEERLTSEGLLPDQTRPDQKKNRTEDVDPPTPPPPESTYPQKLIDFITTYTLELHDDPGNTQANIMRASRIMNNSSLTLDDFLALMGEAKRKAKQHIHSIEKIAKEPAHYGPGQDIPNKNLMPYFFTCLKELIDESGKPRDSPE